MNEDFKIIVTREEDNGVETLGDLSVDTGTQSVFNCETLELPNKNNARQISCIPAAKYNWAKVPASTAIPYPHIAILDVPDRDGVCIHAANYHTQLRGCIAVGKNEIDINGDGQKDVTESKKTFEKLMAILPEKGELIILEKWINQ